jgi:hypothetical protein
MTRRAAAALAFSASMGIFAPACGDDEGKRRGPGKDPKGDPGDMEVWWADLEKDETVATRAVLNMAEWREESVAFLKGKLKPLKISAFEVRALLLKLGNENEMVWKPAREVLEYFDPRLAIDLETLMDRYKESPVRQRMVEVLSDRPAGQLAGKEVILRRLGRGDGFNFFARPDFGSWWAEHRVERINDSRGGNPKKKWTRAVRAILVLEHIGTPGAVALLKDMAAGHPDAQPTRVAKEALVSLGGLDKPRPRE